MKISFKQVVRWFLTLVLIFLALYFRTHVLQGPSSSERKMVRARAVETVAAIMRDQIRSSNELQLSGQSDAVKKKLIDQRLGEIMTAQRGQFEDAVSKMEEKLLASRNSYYSDRYLPEADPYYYYRLTENILKTGKLGEKGRNGTFWDPLRFLPSGSWGAITLHPYLGAWLYQALSRMDPGISVMKAVGFLPLLLTVMIVIAFFWLGCYLGLSFTAVYLGGMVLVLSPMVIQRTVFGWYDTDSYNVFFPILISATFFASIRSPRRAIPWGIAGGFFTAVFSLFWTGWSFIFFLIGSAAVISAGWEGFVSKTGKRLWRYAAAYLPSAVLFAVFLITPGGLWDSFSNSFLFVSKASGASASVWPNFFILIGETNAVSLTKWIYLASNHFTAALAVFGLIAQGHKVWQGKHDSSEFMTWLGWMLIVLPLFVLSLKAERYVLLVVLPFSVFVAFGMEQLREWLDRKISAMPGKVAVKPYRTYLVFLLLFLLIVPQTLRGADVAGRISHVIMNDTWYESMSYLKEKTPQDAIVFSWWSPGHFVTALGDRRVALDGGAQQLKENYWVAKALMSDDERETIGIFRMLAAGGSQAYEFLEREKWDAQVAIRLLLDAVKLDRKQARPLLPQNWPDAKKDELLNLIYGKGVLPPAYLMLYDDLVSNNVILQLTARWDFRKAAEIAKRKKPFHPLALLTGQDQAGYVKNLMEISGPPTPYQMTSAIVQKRGGQILFDNGLMVDEDQKDRKSVV